MTLVKKTFVAMLAASAIGSAQAGVLLADSVADFSGVQGENSWYYGYKETDSGGFFLLRQFDDNYWHDSTYIQEKQLWADHGILAGRRWVSEVTGTVTIDGLLGGDDAYIILNDIGIVAGLNGVSNSSGLVLWQSSEWGVPNPSISMVGNSEERFSFNTVLQKGDTVDFYFGHGGVTITAVPEPETYAMLLAGLGILGAVARRKRVA